MASYPHARTSPCTGQTPFFHQAVLEVQILHLHGENIPIGQALQNCETLCIAQASALPEARFCKNPFMERPIAQLSWEIKAKKMDKLCRASTGHWGPVIHRRREKK